MKRFILNLAWPFLLAANIAGIAAADVPATPDANPFGVSGFNTPGNPNAPKPAPVRRGAFGIKAELRGLNILLASRESELNTLQSRVLSRSSKLAEWEDVVETCKTIEAQKNAIDEDHTVARSTREPQIDALERQKSRILATVEKLDVDLIDAIRNLRTEIDAIKRDVAQKSKTVAELKDNIAAAQSELKQIEVEKTR